MSVSVIDLLVLARARGRRLTEMLAEVRLFAKRAAEPADRVAFAEIEQELLNVREKWMRHGLIFEEVAGAMAEVAGATAESRG